MDHSYQKFNFSVFLQKYGLFIAFFVLCLILSIINEHFLSINNLTNVLRQTSINGILALGMTFVILSGGIDLSVGSILACSGMISASFVAKGSDPNLFLAILSAVAVGTLLGSTNGILISRFKVPPFVATLGMLSAARGLTYIYNDGMPFSGLSPAFRFLGQGYVFGIPVPVLIFIILSLISWFVLKYTIYGRYIYAVGGNIKSAKTSGIGTKKIIFSVYALSGFFAGLVGLILTARTTSALPQAGVSYELDAIAAVVIGGTSLKGGAGSILGTCLGALIIGVINNGLDLMGVSSYYQQVIKGCIIVLAVLMDSTRETD